MTSATPRRGFTLVEMVVVVAIVGVLAAAAHPIMVLQRQRQQELQLRDALRQIRNALDRHKALADEGRLSLPRGATGWPASLDVLVQGAELVPPKPCVPDDGAECPSDAPAAAPGRVLLLRRLPRDPFADPSLPAAETWTLRSSDSPPDAPRPGRDVFDIASRADGRALDGTSYRQW